ncbi:MAG: hypothetical protein RIQ86_658 [Actinomycetota bacterium]
MRGAGLYTTFFLVAVGVALTVALTVALAVALAVALVVAVGFVVVLAVALAVAVGDGLLVTAFALPLISENATRATRVFLNHDPI